MHLNPECYPCSDVIVAWLTDGHLRTASRRSSVSVSPRLNESSPSEPSNSRNVTSWPAASARPRIVLMTSRAVVRRGDDHP